MRTILALLVLMTAAESRADLIVFLTDVPAFENLERTVQPATTGEFDIWVRTPERIAHMSLDLMTRGDSIQFTGSKVHNPYVPVGNTHRWAYTSDFVSFTPDYITSMSGGAYIGSNGSGIGPTTAANDTFYDSGLDAFRYATVSYEAVANGLTELFLRVGSNKFGFHQQNAPIHLGIGHESVTNESNTTDAIADGRITVAPYSPPGDLDGDGSVTTADYDWVSDPVTYTIWRDAMAGQSVPLSAASVPEPATWLLVVLGAVALAWRVR